MRRIWASKLIYLIECENCIIIDPFNKFNIYSFPLLTTNSAFEILLKTYSFNDVNSGKLYILDLLKGSIKPRKFEVAVGKEDKKRKVFLHFYAS